MPVQTLTRTVAVGVHGDVPPAVITAQYPAATVGREFIPPLHDGEVRDKVLDRIHAFTGLWAGRVYVSYKPDPAEVAAGRWTAVHHRIGEWLAAHPQVVIIVHHEPEGRLDGATFRSMFERARDEIKAGGPGARVAYCAMAYQWRPGGNGASDPAEWSRVVADEYLCDVYSGMRNHHGAFPAGLILPEHPGYAGWFGAIVRPRLLAGDTTIRYGLAERGFMDDPVRAATIRRESAWLDGVVERYAATGRPTDLPPSTYLAWSSGGAENERGWVLTGDAVRAMSDLLGDFVGKSGGRRA